MPHRQLHPEADLAVMAEHHLTLIQGAKATLETRHTEQALEMQGHMKSSYVLHGDQWEYPDARNLADGVLQHTLPLSGHSAACTSL